MARKKRNFIEAAGEDDYTGRDAGKKKPHARQRRSTDAKYKEARELFDESAVEETPPPARNLHVVARMPDKKAPYRIEPAREAAAQEPLPAESDEERLAGLEEKISRELTEPEQRFAKSCIDEYPKELEKAINKIESKGLTVAEKQILAIRTSYMGDVKRWGLGRQLAPEKAELIGEYLELKLPVGIPEEKAEINGSKTENATEANFTPEQSSKLVALIREARKIQDQIDPEDFQEIIEVIIREDLIAQGIFSEEDFSRAFGHAVKWIEKLNKKK